VFDISFNNVSWAAARGLTLDDEFGGRRER
jgi:hypothetical protein